jgi:hypothetical protein
MAMLSKEAQVIERLFYIQNKEGQKVPFILNKAQRFLDEHDNAFDKTRLIIAKARQKGFSSVIIGKFAVRCLGKEGTHAVIMSHEAQATQRLLDRAQFCFKHMRGAKPNYGRNSRNELYFPKLESTYYIGTAGARAFGRGDWITDLHCSEYAWWEDPLRHSAGLFQAVPLNGRIYIESTGNGQDNDFYYMWKHADEIGYERLFYPWYADSEYEIDPLSADGVWRPDLPRYNAYLLDVRHRHNLSDRKMAWYELKLKEMHENLPMMQQEYPTTPEECFQATGGRVFGDLQLTESLDWRPTRLDAYHCNSLSTHPRPGYHYVVGADPAGGTGHDDSAMVVFCCETWEQTLEFFNNRINPVEFARLLARTGAMYNQAYIVSEANNHGLAVLGWLRENYDKALLYKHKLGTANAQPKYGWQNTKTTKHMLVGTMQEHLGELTLYGKQTVAELEGFREVEEGKMEGKSDNLVIATGLALLGLLKQAHLRGGHLPKLEQARPKRDYRVITFEEIIDSIRRKRVRSQAGEGYPYA